MNKKLFTRDRKFLYSLVGVGWPEMKMIEPLNVI